MERKSSAVPNKQNKNAHAAALSAPFYAMAVPSPCCDYPTAVLRRLAETVESHAHEIEATDTLFFFTIVLLIGVFTLHVLARHVPYTALLLVSGEGGIRG